MGAQVLHRSQSFLGNYFRRMKARLGAPKALTAAAHKFARIVDHMVTTRQQFDATVFESRERSCQHRKQIRLQAQARELGFDLVKLNAQAAS
jgi:hypothetical protein